MATLEEYMDMLRDRAMPIGPDGARIVKNRTLNNFLKHHRVTRVESGVPVWRRLPSYYETGPGRRP